MRNAYRKLGNRSTRCLSIIENNKDIDIGVGERNRAEKERRNGNI